MKLQDLEKKKNSKIVYQKLKQILEFKYQKNLF